MTKKTPSILISLAVAWTSVGQVPAVFAQAEAEGRVVAPATVAMPLGAALSAPALPTALTTPEIPALTQSALPASPEAAQVQPAAAASVSAAQASASADAPAAVAAPQAETASLAPAAAIDPQAAAAFEALKAAVRRTAPADATVPSAAAPQTVFGRLASAVKARLSGLSLFDGSQPAVAGRMGILPLPKPTLPQGLDLDEAPQAPAPKKVGGVEVNAFDLPGAPAARTAGQVFDAGPRVLSADPRSEADMERALRALVDQDAAKFGVTSAELSTVHVRLVKGRGKQADTVYAYFRQQQTGTNPDGSPYRIPVHGTYLSFTVKIIKGKPVLMAAMAKLYPNLQVDTRQRKTDDELRAAAEARLGIPANSGAQMEFVERKVIFAGGSWHAANLYQIEGLPFMIAIDIASGQAFAWDERMGIGVSPAELASRKKKTDGATASVSAVGRGEKGDKRPNGQPDLSELTLPYLDINVNGKTYRTDADGKLTGVAVTAPTQVEVTLTGRRVRVLDAANQPLTLTATLTPGQEAKLVFNPTGSDLFKIDQVNLYVAVTRIIDWWSGYLQNDKRLERQFTLTANEDDECNAYYEPGRWAAHFFRKKGPCSDTAKPGVAGHEVGGHGVDDVIGGITNGGMSEGWGDIAAMFFFGTRWIGEGFILDKSQAPYPNGAIRDGENAYQYSEQDEVHDQGQAWMGFGWKLRKALIASLGEAAGAAEANALVLPTMLAKADNIPAQMAQVLLNSMDKDGKIRYEKEIRAAAKAHGIDLPQNPGLVASLWKGATSPLRALRLADSLIERPEAEAAPSEPTLLAAEVQGAPAQPSPAAVRGKLSFSAGALVRRQAQNAIRQYCDFHGLKYELKEYKGWLSSDFLLTVEGPQDKVEYLFQQIQAWSRQ